MTVKGIHSAAKWTRRRDYLNYYINSALEPAFARLGMCGHSRWSMWMYYVSHVFFVDCSCCLLWRGIIIGLTLGILIG